MRIRPIKLIKLNKREIDIDVRYGIDIVFNNMLWKLSYRKIFALFVIIFNLSDNSLLSSERLLFDN